MAESKSTEQVAHTHVEVRITSTLDRDLDRRNVFPDLRIKKAERVDNGAAVFRVSIEQARELYADVREQHRVTGRGLKKSYGALLAVLSASTANEAPLVVSDKPKKPSGVAHNQYVWGDRYVGTKIDLIAAGLAAEGQFPGDPGCAASSCSYDAKGAVKTVGSPTKLSIKRYGKKFELSIRVSREENDRRSEEQARTTEWRKRAAEAEAEVAQELAKLSDLPSSKKEFAKRAAETFWSGYHIFVSPYCGRGPDGAGYSFSAADRVLFTDMARRIYWEIRNAKPRFDAAHRMSGVTAARAKAAKVDMPLQRLLSSAKATAGAKPKKTEAE